MPRPRLRILVISKDFNPPGTGGVATHVRYLTDALNKAIRCYFKSQIQVLTTGSKTVGDGNPPSLIVHRVGGVDGHFPSSENVPFDNALHFLNDNWWKLQPNIIHAHDFEAIQIGLIAQATYKVPLVATIHKAPKEWDSTSPQRDPKDGYLEFLKARHIPISFIAPSRAYRDRLRQQKFSRARIHLIPHGIPTEFATSQSGDPKILEKFNLMDSHELILCPSRADPHKGIETFFEAAKTTLERTNNKNLIFAVAGSAPENYRTRLNALAVHLGIESNVRLGPSDNKDVAPDMMPALFRRAKLCVVPSRREGFGLVILEAFATKCPVIASNTGGIPEIIDPQKTGLLFHRDEASSLAQQIIRLLADEDLRNIIIKAAHKKIFKEFSAARMAKDHLNLYRHLIEQHEQHQQ